MRTTSLMSVAVLAGAFGLATTGWGGSEEISAQSNDATAEPTFGVSLTTDKAIYAAGETIVLELVVFNRSAANLTFDFGSAQHYDFIIEDTEGNSVWTWAECRMFGQVLGEEVIGPGRVAGGLLVFLKCMKELPITLILRPAGFDTLATQMWAQAEEGYEALAALPALILLFLSAVPIMILMVREVHRSHDIKKSAKVA